MMLMAHPSTPSWQVAGAARTHRPNACAKNADDEKLSPPVTLEIGTDAALSTLVLVSTCMLPMNLTGARLITLRKTRVYPAWLMDFVEVTLLRATR